MGLEAKRYEQEEGPAEHLARRGHRKGRRRTARRVRHGIRCEVKPAHARGLVHVDPRAVDVDTRVWVVEHLELVCPEATREQRQRNYMIIDV